MQVPIGPTQVRVSVYSPSGSLLILDASADLVGGALSYEDTPSGNGSAQLVLGMTFEAVEAAGYWTARNLIELSSGDDALQADCLAGSSKLYIGSTEGYDTALGHDLGQISLYDGSTLTMRVPVTGVGTDGGGPFITVGAPLAGGGNPATLPAYTAGSLVLRRRYSGIVMGRTRPNQKAPATVVRCAGLAQRINEAVCTFTLTTGTMDVGTAMFTLLSQFAARWPELTISGANFPATGQTTFTGSYDRTQIARVISDLTSAANSSGNVWTIRVGHDRTPRLVKVYTQSGNTYTYNVTLPQGVQYFEPRNFVNTDQDASQLYNTVEIIGDTDPATQQPVTAIVQDTTSVSLYGQIDAQPVTNTACKTAAQCALYGQALLNQQATPKANAQFVVSTRNDVSNAGPMGLSRGDVVLGLQNVTVTSFEGSAANVYGLSSSVVTTVSPAGDTVQNVRFSAIEPDWNEAMKERANALASSLHQNLNTGAGISSYCVSAGAFIGVPSTTALTVSAPLFAAIFANGTAPVTCGGNTFTLLSATTNWVWLLSSGTWVVNQSPTPVANAILYGIFTTSGDDRLETESGIEITTESGTHIGTETGAIIGFIQKASIGVVELSQAQLPSMGSQGAPVLTSVSGVSYPVVGNATYDAQVTFTVDVHSASWLVGIALFAVAHGSAADPRDFPKGQVDVGQSTAGVYTPIWKSIGAGNSEDLYVAYLDGQGRLSPVALVGTTTANHAGYSALLGVPLTAPNPSSAASAFTYYSMGASTFDAECTINLDTNGTTTNNALAEIETVIAPHSSGLISSSDGWTPVGSVQIVNGTGVYNIAAGGLGAGTAYDVGVRYVGQNGSRSYVYIVATTAANPQHVTNLPSMGAQAAPVLSALSTITYPAIGNGTYDAEVTLTVDVHTAPWLVGLVLYAGNTVGWTGAQWAAVAFAEPVSSGTYTLIWPGLGAGSQYYLGVAYEDGQGVQSAIAWLGTYSAPAGTTSANPAGTSAFAAIPTTAPNPSSAAGTLTYSVNGGGTYDAECTIHLDASGTTANNALAEIECVMAPHASGLTSTSDGWTPSGAPIAVNGTGTYVTAWGGCGVQVQYDVGVRYIGHTGSRSYVYIIGTTTAAQLAQLPFVGAKIDPATGYIVISDQAVYPTALHYTLSAAGVGSLLSAAMSVKAGSTSVDPTVWLMYTAASGGSGYIAYWNGSNQVQIEKCSSGVFSLLATSTLTVAHDATNFHNLEFIATETTSGTVNLTAILDGSIMCQVADSSSPYTSGAVAINFRDATATNYIDEKTLRIEFAGSPSSSGIKAQGSVVPTSIPQVILAYNPTASAVFVSNVYYSGTIPAHTMTVGPAGGTLYFQDGSAYPFTTTIYSGSCAASTTYYILCGINLATGATVFSVTTGALTPSQIVALIPDGVTAVLTSYSLSVGTGAGTTLIPGAFGRVI